MLHFLSWAKDNMDKSKVVVAAFGTSLVVSLTVIPPLIRPFEVHFPSVRPKGKWKINEGM